MAVAYIDHPLRKARQMRRLGAETLAAATGVSIQQIYNIELGRRVRVWAHEMIALGRALDMDPMDLLSPENRTGKPKKPQPKRIRKKKV